MPISGNKIVAPVGIATVNKMLGAGESSVTNLAVKALRGGTTIFSRGEIEFKTAFDLTTGSLLSTAVPYWNICSDNSPGEFYITGATSSEALISFRLKNDPVLPGTLWNANLGLWDGYDKSSILINNESTVNLQETSSSGEITFYMFIDFSIDLGTYDWTKLFPLSEPVYWGVRCKTADGSYVDYMYHQPYDGVIQKMDLIITDVEETYGDKTDIITIVKKGNYVYKFHNTINSTLPTLNRLNQTIVQNREVYVGIDLIVTGQSTTGTGDEYYPSNAVVKVSAYHGDTQDYDNNLTITVSKIFIFNPAGSMIQEIDLNNSMFEAEPVTVSFRDGISSVNITIPNTPSIYENIVNTNTVGTVEGFIVCSVPPTNGIKFPKTNITNPY